jgi:hypothetical protein
MLGRGAVLRNSLRAGALRSDNRSKSEHEAWACCAAHARPTPCASRHGQRVENPIRAIAALGLDKQRNRGRAQRWPVWFSTPVAAPAAQRLRGGACTAGCTRSCSDSRGLSERSTLARRVPPRTPQTL